jgi:Holliday junction DNA helicase RuvA
MIAFLRGVLLEKHPNQVIIDVQGTGYDVAIPVSTFSALPDAGATLSLRVYTHVREDALALFGFRTKEEEQVFRRLISVSGIGPKLALTVLSGLAVADLVNAIRAAQVDLLVRIPGVGRKTAERMVLELKDKLNFAVDGAAPVPPAPALSPVEHDVLSALMNLGLNQAAAEQAIKKAKTAGSTDDFESLFRRAMEHIR